MIKEGGLEKQKGCQFIFEAILANVRTLTYSKYKKILKYRNWSPIFDVLVLFGSLESILYFFDQNMGLGGPFTYNWKKWTFF